MPSIDFSCALSSWWTNILKCLLSSSWVEDWECCFLHSIIFFPLKICTCVIAQLVLEGPNIWPWEYFITYTFQFGKFQRLYLKTLCTFYLKLIIENPIACLHYFKVSFKTLKLRVTQCDYISQEIIRTKCLSNPISLSLYSSFTTYIIKLFNDSISYFIQSIWVLSYEKAYKIMLIESISHPKHVSKHLI